MIGKIPGGGKENYGEQRKKILDESLEKMLDKEFKIDGCKLKLQIINQFIKRFIYSKNKEMQKVGWSWYHDLSPKEQKAFKAEIRAEEKARKAK